MELRVGSSGFSYDFWKGSFYPADIHSDAMLAFYAERFDTVEINNTFYRMPKAEVLRRWADAVPASFRFSIKASRRITHESRLEGTADNVAYLFRQLEALGDKLGCVLFQCPGNLRKHWMNCSQPLLAICLTRRPIACQSKSGRYGRACACRY